MSAPITAPKKPRDKKAAVPATSLVLLLHDCRAVLAQVRGDAP